MSADEQAPFLAALEETEAAVARALVLFRRIRDLRAFGAGNTTPGVTPDDEAVEENRARVITSVEALAPLLLGACDRHGNPMDFPHLGADGQPASAIGRRGGKLCAALVHLVGDVQDRNADGCVDDLEQLESHLRQIRNDIGAVEPSREATANTPPPKPGLKEPPQEAWMAYRLHKLAGCSQPETATTMQQELGRRVQQYQVSRWCRAVTDFVEAGGILPPGLAENTRDAPADTRTVDPSQLDKGPRADRGRRRRKS